MTPVKLREPASAWGGPATVVARSLAGWMARSHTKEHLVAMAQRANLNLADERRARRRAEFHNWVLVFVVICVGAAAGFGWWLALGGGG